MERTERTAIATSSLSALFAGVLLFLAVHFHDVSFLAGGILTISRVVTGFLVAAGIRLSKRHTERFKSRLYKLENLVATVIGILILVGAYELGRLVLFKARTGEALITGPGKAIPTLLFASLLALAVSMFKKKVAKEENCPSLMADSQHSVVDAAAMFVIALGVAISAAGIQVADLAAALIVSAVVFVSGGRIAIDGIKVLLDASIEKDILEEIKKIIREDPRIRDIVEASGRNSGSYRFLFLKLVPYQYDVQVTAGITDDLKKKIQGRIKNIDDISIEYGPEKGDRKNVAIPLNDNGYSIGSELFGAESFAIFDIDLVHRRIISKSIVKNPFAGKVPGNDVRLAVLLARQGVDVLIFEGTLRKGDAVQTLEAYDVDLLPWTQAATTVDIEAMALESMENLKSAEGRIQ